MENLKFQILSVSKSKYKDFKTRALVSSVKQKLGHLLGGWMERWVDGKAGLMIAYSNQKIVVSNFHLFLTSDRIINDQQ